MLCSLREIFGPLFLNFLAPPLSLLASKNSMTKPKKVRTVMIMAYLLTVVFGANYALLGTGHLFLIIKCGMLY